MKRKILLVEPNYRNKFPPIGLMKLATYHKRLGDEVVFFKGDCRDFIVERLCEKCTQRLYAEAPTVDWNAQRHNIAAYIRTRKRSHLTALALDRYDNELLLLNWLTYYKDYFWQKLYLQEPEWDRVFITTLFTFYFDTTVQCINDFKHLAKPGCCWVGGVLATLQSRELEGATGVKPFVGLMNRPHVLDADNEMIVDNLPLDYTILDETDYVYEMSNAFYASLTKGCRRHCPFCAVPTLEPDYEEYIPLRDRIEEVRRVCGDKRDLLLMDNNVMASNRFDDIINDIVASGFAAGAMFTQPDYLAIAVSNLSAGINNRAYLRRSRQLILDFYHTVKDPDLSYEIYSAITDHHLLHIETTTAVGVLAVYNIVRPYYEKRLRQKRPVRRRVDFNQGVDARLFTPHKAQQLARIAISPLRIAFDDMRTRTDYERAVRLSAEAGITSFSNYLLYNFRDEPIDLYRRLLINVELSEQLNVDIYSFPMKYQPLHAAHSHDKNYVGERWNMKYIRAVQAVLNVTRGCVGRGTSFFRRAFGSSEQEYMDILLMPDTMILYRFFFEWLETKGHPFSKWRWQRFVDILTAERRAMLLDCLNAATPLNDPEPWLAALLPFYRNMRDDIASPDGSLHALKQEFDALGKQERDAILARLKQEYGSGR